MFRPDFDWLAKAHEDFRQPFFPENKLGGHRQKDRPFDARGQVAQARLETQRPFPHVGEAALRRDHYQATGVA